MNDKKSLNFYSILFVICFQYLFLHIIKDFYLRKAIIKNVKVYLRKNNFIGENFEKNKDLKRKEISELNIELMIARKVLNDALYLKR